MISQIYISFQTLSLFSSLSPLFSLPILQRSLPGELMLWTMFHEQLDFLGLVSFSPHCSIYSTVVSFLSSIFLLSVSLEAVDGGRGRADEAFVVSVGRCSASPLVDFIQDGTRFGFCRTFGEADMDLSLPIATPCTFSFHFIVNPNAVPPPTLHQ
jgi:hypothetical protein